MNKAIECLRDKVSSNYNAEMGKSCLKSKLESYLNLMPLVNVEKLEKLFDKDEESC